jgi:DNA-binding NarL/FixJ family response regulator
MRRGSGRYFRCRNVQGLAAQRQMPGINGIETARRMAEIAPAIPILLFTQHASADLERHAHEVGIRSVVSKTNAFPMVGMIEELLGSASADPQNGSDGSGSKKL